MAKKKEKKTYFDSASGSSIFQSWEVLALKSIGFLCLAK
jgi:hypothetical protein